MQLIALKMLAQPILQALLATAAIGATALVLGRRAEHRLQQVRIPVDTPRPRTRPRR